MKSIFTILFLLGIAPMLFAQEGLYPLSFNAALQDKANGALLSRDQKQLGEFTYLIDTLELPFFDDFSSNKIKRYNAEKGSSNVIPSYRTSFSVDGAIPAIFEYMTVPTFNYTKNLNGTVDSTINPDIIITNYDTNGAVSSLDTGWTNIISTTNLITGIITLDTLSPDRVRYNSYDTTYLVLDDPTSVWTTTIESIGDRGAYINNRFVKFPITQGVATFDGTDAQGFPYDATAENSYGKADLLESKPIYIDSLMDNIFLSFFYMKGGIGNAPDEEDSLVLEFFNVRDKTWEHVWSVNGNGIADSLWSDQIILEVSGNKFQRPGFKFRFSNYSTLSGAFDHWHIDYVRMDNGISETSLDTIADVAYLSGFGSYFNEYTSVPYSHYLAAPIDLQGDNNQLIVRNLGVEAVYLDALKFELKDETNATLLTATDIIDNFGPNTVAIKNYTLPNSQIFPDLDKERVFFETTCSFKVTGNNDERINDTIRSTTEMWDYYSYDDGTAESAYALTGAGLTLAYEFESPVEDTLQAIYFNFPQMLHDDNGELDFAIKIWSNLNENPIYEDIGYRTPAYTRGNEFARYELQEDVIVNGTFYVGFQQIDDTKIYIGFDKNNNAQSHLAYKVIGEDWQPSKFQGALMIRPDFGSGAILSVPSISDKTTELSIYPNPSNGLVYINGITEATTLEVYNTAGVLVFTQEADNSTQIDLSNQPIGMYFIKGIGQNSGNIYTGKVMITL